MPDGVDAPNVTGGSGFGPAPRSNVTRWRGGPCGAAPTKLRRVRTRSAFAAQETIHESDSRGVDPAGLYPDPSDLNTFCREPAGSSAGEADAPGRFRALAALTRNQSAAGRTGSVELPSRACFREARGPLPACAVKEQGPLLTLSRDGEGDPQCPRCLPSRGAPPPGRLCPETQAKDRPARGWTSIHRLFPSCG